MIHNKIIFRGFEFDDDSIFSGSVSLSDALVGEELPIDSMVFETLNFDLAVGLLDSAGTQLLDANGTRLLAGSSSAVDLSEWEYGEPVTYYHNGNLIGKFYVESAKKLARYRGEQQIEVYRFTCVSSVGLLEAREHYGGMYEATPAGDILSEIIGDLNIEVESAVATTVITGHLPKASARKNLHWILNATGASLIKNAAGDPFVAYVSSPEPREIADEFFQGETVTYSSPSTAATVTEHAFIASETDEEIELYDSSEASIEPINVPVLFDEPVHSLTADGLTLGAHNCNYAIVSGFGKLYGKKYTHITTEITQSTGVSGVPKIVTSSENTLVSVLNSVNVAKRLAEYASTREQIKYETSLTEPMRPSDDIRWTNQFGEVQTGYVRNLGLIMSKDLGAKADIVLGWTPKYLGNNAGSVDMLTGTGTYTVPSGVTEIRVVMIGGGAGGQAGHKGGDSGSWAYVQSGLSSGTWKLSSEDGGSPGEKGLGGAGGNIFTFIQHVSPGQQFSYNCGIGGAPGSINGELGEFGTDSVFGSRSSAEGASSLRGFQHPLTGAVYGAPGLDGIIGAKGGDYRFEGYTIGLPGDDLTYNGTTWNGGAPGHFSSTSTMRYWGAAGGGAAYGANGGDVTDTYEINGGPGAASTTFIPTTTTNGSGGRGGNGGGGGGAPGTKASRGSSAVITGGGEPGLGGDGSPAQPGANGVIFVLH